MSSVIHLLDGGMDADAGGVERHVQMLLELGGAELLSALDLNRTPRRHRFLDLLSSNASAFSLLNQNSSALLHVHQILPWGLPVLIRESAYRPVVLTVHDWFYACQRVHLRNRWGQPCSGPGSLKCSFCTGGAARFPLHFPLYRNRHRMMQTFLQLCRAIIVPNPDIKKALPSSCHSRVRVIDYAVQTGLNSEEQFDPKGPVVAVGNTGLHKGLEWLRDQWTAESVPLRLFGPGTQEFPEGEGPVASIKSIPAARALIIASDWRETGPMVLMEALSLGIPVFARKGSLTPSRVLPGVRLFERPPDEQALQAEIPRMREEISKSPYPAQEKKANLLLEHRSLYEELLS